MIIPHVSLAKITRPSFSGLLPRERLFDRLDEARNSPVIWITGPPGSGKTTAAASYLEHRGIASLWYQFDDGDSDIASFFFHLGMAYAQRSRRKMPRLPQLTPQHHAGFSAFARRYFQALFRELGSPFTLVFDDCHELSPQSPLHDILLPTLSDMPPGGTVMFISRTDPPGAMARLRANRKLEVIGWRELQLTREESNAIAAKRGRDLSDQTLGDLFHKTQGWAAGLILMLEQASSDDTVAAPSDLSTPQLVFDYLAGEIFDKADSGMRELMLSTVYLPQMTPDMACALSGLPDAGARLSELHRNNYFMTLRKAHPNPVYEYHPLMREFATARAGVLLSRDKRAQLQRKSAELLEATGLVTEAALLLRSSGEWELIAALLRRHARAMLNAGRGETVAQWVESLPKEMRDRNPWTLYWLAVARMHASPRESRILHEQAHELFDRQPEPDLRGLLFTCSGAMDAILHEVDDFSLLDRWIDITSRLLHSHPGLISGPLEARIACSLFTSMVVRQPHHPEIEQWGERAHRAAMAEPDINVRMSVEPRVALGITYGGHFPNAWAIIESTRKLVSKHDVPPISLTMLKLVEATYFMLTAQREPCYQAVREGLEIEQTEGISVFSRQLLAYGAGGALTAGDLDAAADFLARFAAIPGTAARFDLCLFHLFSTWLAMRRNDPVVAYQQQKLALRMAIEVGCPVFEVLCRVATAYVQYAGGEQRAGWAQFQQVYDISRHIHNRLLEYTGLMAYAYVALDSGRRARSGARSLRYALEIAKSRNYTSFLLWCPAPLARLCSLALEARIEPDFVATLIRERGLAMDASQAALIDWPWPLRVQTLGPFRLLKNGVAVVFSGKAQRRPLDLLKVVIASGGRGVSTERVTEALWPRVDGDSAHRSFTTTLHRLRKLLGDDRAVTLSEGKLTLDGNRIWVDTWAFEQVTFRITQTVRQPRNGANADAIEALGRQMMQFYAGAFLENEAEASWNLAARDRSRQRFRHAIAELSQHWQKTGQPERALDLLEQALDIDAIAEALYHRLMQCYVQLGRKNDALATYERCRKMLSVNLNVAPSPETSALRDTLVRPA
jgi:LuxR family transcriptional regulator, maltose regulon positive regulatory protein